MMLAMFVKTTRRKRGDKSYEYLSLVEAVREGGKTGHRTLLRLGEVTALRESGQLDRIIAALRAHAERPWAALDEATIESARSVGTVAAVRTIWDRLGLGAHFDAIARDRRLSYSLGDATFAMVANRLGDPCSKRRLPEWLACDVAVPGGFVAPELEQLYRALDQVQAAKEQTETHLYARLTDLANLDLRLVCYDLTSTYFEGSVTPSARFPSRAFGYRATTVRTVPRSSSACSPPPTASPSPTTSSPATPPTSPRCRECSKTSRPASAWAGSAWSPIVAWCRPATCRALAPKGSRTCSPPACTATWRVPPP